MGNHDDNTWLSNLFLANIFDGFDREFADNHVTKVFQTDCGVDYRMYHVHKLAIISSHEIAMPWS
jgi:hypothetical protein